MLLKLESEEEKLKSLNRISVKVYNLLKDFLSFATSLSCQIGETHSAVDVNVKRIKSNIRELA